ncbi:MAG: hypothetical protein CMO26_03490 [Thiotrichales bacterium]|nr:hypothetical protein [Thiotrichales bacterium]
MRWTPDCEQAALVARAQLLARVRTFFAERDVLEVETPLLGAGASTDPMLASLHTEVLLGADRQRLYLQTSPEFFMKRLLCAGSGDIYQICKAFRDRETGSLHNPEFTILEWYRVGYDHHALMDEVAELITAVLGPGETERVSYRSLFQQHVGIDPLAAADSDVVRSARQLTRLAPDTSLERDEALELLLAEVIQPKLAGRRVFIHDFPASQAALARLSTTEPVVAERFELYVAGIELANGFHELGSSEEQRARFQAELLDRERRGLPWVPMDEQLLAALQSGLPPCAGVALGIDRLLLASMGEAHIDQVIAFAAGLDESEGHNTRG